jgi:hypothetical protein
LAREVIVRSQFLGCLIEGVRKPSEFSHGLVGSCALGRADTPIMHFVHLVFWFGYVPILTGRPRRIVAAAKTPVWLARIPQGAVRTLLTERPGWWRHLIQFSIIYGDVSQTIAADLLIRDSTAPQCS